MKRTLIYIAGILLFLQQGYAQQLQTWLENFDGALPPAGWSAAPNGAWKSNATYYVSNPKSYWGTVPNNPGDSTILETGVYNCTGGTYVYLKFSHICKISPLDRVRIEYKEVGMPVWTPLPASRYLGYATNYGTTGFNAASYSQWQANDSTASPTSSWWEEEFFDLGQAIGGKQAQFRFVIKHGSQIGTQISYGWFIDNFELMVSGYEIEPPTVQFITPLVKDTVYSTGPWVINAKIKTNSKYPIEIPIFTWDTNGVYAGSDTMKIVRGDSLWQTTIPQYKMGTTVTYSITAIDSVGNNATASSEYYIKQSCGSGSGGGDGVPTNYSYTGNVVPVTLLPGIYELECWGAQSAHHAASGTTYQGLGSLGGYSKGTLTVRSTTTYYICVGGTPPSTNHYAGGYNGGGSAFSYAGGGGGATHIATASGLLPTLSSNQSAVVIVAGGAGGGRVTAALGGVGGGVTGGSGMTNGTVIGGTGGTATAGGINGTATPANTTSASFGQGASCGAQGGSGGGGGWYGGGIGGYSSNNSGAGGGSGYIGGVTNGITVQPTDPLFVANPETNGNGFARITFISGGGSSDECVDNSAAMYSIDKPDIDTISTSPTTQTPIVVTVKNTGTFDLDSVTVSYIINGGNQKDTLVEFVPALPWDYTKQITLGSYVQRASNSDVLTIWVSLPNGQYDSTTFDDTLSKKIYGTSDMFAEFVTNPTDTVHNTGPFEVTAKIITLSGTPIGVVNLEVEYIEHEISNVTKYYTLPMQQNGDLWTAYIPQIRVESDVAYKILLTDILGNIIDLSDNYYIKRSCGGGGGNGMYSYTGSAQPVQLQAGIYEIECWGANGGNATQGTGGKGGYSKGTLTVNNPTTYYIYVGGKGTTVNAPAAGGWNGGGAHAAGSNHSTGPDGGTGGGGTDIRTTQNTTYANRIIVAGGGGGAAGYSTYTNGHGGNGGGLTGANGASTRGATYAGGGGTQIAGGAASTGAGTTYSLPGGFGIGGDYIGTLGGTAGGGGWYGGGSGAWGGAGGGGSGYIGGAGITNGVTAQSGTTDFVANPDNSGNGFVKITLIAGFGDCDDTNSVAMDAILSPTERAVAGVQNPILVKIKNVGLADLDSCELNWSLNGTTQLGTPHIYRNAAGLPEGFTDTVTIGHYLPSSSTVDEIIVWVSMPNGQIDSNMYDDTLKVIALGCGTPLAGDVTIGAGKNFPTIEAALETMRDCGVGGDIRLLIASGTTYTTAWNFTNSAWNGIDFGNIMGSYMLTFASETGNRNDVTINTTATTPVVTLNNTNNLTLEALTFGRKTNAPVVQFTGACTNIVLRNCNLLGDTTTTSSTAATVGHPLYKASSTGVVDNFRMVGCLLDGGYYNAYFYGGTANSIGNLGTNIVWDSNTFKSGYYYALSPLYCYFTSISYNTFLGRVGTGVPTYQYMLYTTTGCHVEDIIGNKINQRGVSSYIYGLYLSSANLTTVIPGKRPTMIVNNEIIATTYGSATYGIYLSGTGKSTDPPIYVLNNSVYFGGTGAGAARGINTASVPTGQMNIIKNNMIHTSGTASYPIYLGTAFATTLYDIDYNNMYASTNVGYVTGATPTARPNIASWQTVVPTDQNSVSVLPSFINSSINLKLSDYTGLDCPLLPLVSNDIEDKIRFSPTTMGCYESELMDNDIAVVQFLGVIKNGVTVGQTHPVSVVVQNRGKNTITSLDLDWFIDSGLQGTISNYPLSLALWQSDTIPLGNISYTLGIHNLRAEVKTINSILDENHKNDTLKLTYESCSSSLSGTVTIGSSVSAMYPNIASAVLAMEQCGIENGKVTLALEDGTYNESVDFSKIWMKATDTLEIVSSLGNANNVIIAASNFGIKVGEGNNILIKNITINLTGVGYGIFLGSGDNIEINGCIINLDTTLGNLSGGSNKHNAICKLENSGIANNVRILNNVITGGYNAVFIYAGNADTLGANWVFDGNTVQNAYWQSIFLIYADFLSVSNNISRPMTSTAYTGTGWYGLYLFVSNAKIVQGNRIYGQNHPYQDPYGMYFYRTNAKIAPAEIYNNEILLVKNANSATADLFHFEESQGKIYHNSFAYVTEANATMSAVISINGGAQTNLRVDVKNNNLIAALSLPIQVNNIGTNVITLNYNNYYSGGPAVANLQYTDVATLSDWRTLTGQDANSVSVYPPFSDFPQSMNINDEGGILCPALPAVATDINNAPRQYSFTAMGAYELIPSATEKVKLKLHNFPNEATIGQVIPIEVEVVNLSSILVNSIQFEYSLSGNAPVARTWNAPSPLNFLSGSIANLGSITAIGDTAIEVWIVTVNNMPNALADTVSENLKVKPLAEFTYPLVADTISSLSFEVNVLIRELTGAPASAPEMHIHTIMNGCDFSSIIPMTYDVNKGIWTANIPKQYYGSKVVYEVHISDTVTPPNSIILKDSTYIRYGGGAGGTPMNYSYTGNVQSVQLKRGTYKIECWGAEGGATNGGGAASGISKIGGQGGYSVGELTLTSTSTVNIYVGGQGLPQAILAPGGFNGGGASGAGTTIACGSGGGASDIRINSTSLYSRVIVAGGGGAGGFQVCNGTSGAISGGYGGGTTGVNPPEMGTTYAGRVGQGGTQTAGGAAGTGGNSNSGTAGTFGLGGNGANPGTPANGGGGGGGWYGGGGGADGSSCAGGAGGGSGYVYTSSTAGNYPSGCLLNTSHYLANAQTIAGNQSFLAPNGTNEIGHSGNGFVRITPMGVSDDAYPGNNLALLSVVSPVNNISGLCEITQSPVEVLLANLGENDYDFSKDSIKIAYEIKVSTGITYNGSVSINTSELVSGETETFTLVDTLALTSGTYVIKAWVISPLDNFVCDDTVSSTYKSGAVGLPIDEDFSSGIPADKFGITYQNTTHAWVPVAKGQGADVNLVPLSGTQMLAFGGNRGAMVQFSTKQIALSRTRVPELNFWYYHDTLDCEDYTDVRITTNGAATYETLFSLRKQGDTLGWKHYSVDLSKYTSGTCVSLLFESMALSEKMDYSYQYIDRIQIISQQDLGLSDLNLTIIPGKSVCDFTTNLLTIKRATTTNQTIDFSKYSTGIQVNITGPVNSSSTYSLTDILGGDTSDIITLAKNINLVPGTYNVVAYLTAPVDEYQPNDTVKAVITVNPHVKISSVQMTQAGSCFLEGMSVNPEVIIENRGNIGLFDLPMQMVVEFFGDTIYTFNDTLRSVLKAGDVVRQSIQGRYVVRHVENYNVVSTIELACDANIGDHLSRVPECVDLNDLALVDFIEPNPSKTVDIVGESITIKVRLDNRNPVGDYNNVNITAQIIENGGVTNTFTEKINRITFSNHNYVHTFSSYTVPDASQYTIKVFIDKVDSYQNTDTLTSKRETNKGISIPEGVGFVLGQNIPNPASNSTRIDYVIPTDGEALFTVYSITGQTLYSETVTAEAGKHSLDFNTDALANGIYYYSMTFKGQQIVKKMNVQR